MYSLESGNLVNIWSYWQYYTNTQVAEGVGGGGERKHGATASALLKAAAVLTPMDDPSSHRRLRHKMWVSPPLLQSEQLIPIMQQLKLNNHCN